MPKFLPLNSIPKKPKGSQPLNFPFLRYFSASLNLRVTANSKPIAKSPHASVKTSGVLATFIPSDFAAFVSMLLYPTAKLAITFSFFAF